MGGRDGAAAGKHHWFRGVALIWGTFMCILGTAWCDSRTVVSTAFVLQVGFLGSAFVLQVGFLGTAWCDSRV